MVQGVRLKLSCAKHAQVRALLLVPNRIGESISFHVFGNHADPSLSDIVP